MVPDPQDPECCKVPQCPQGNTVPPVIIGTQSPTPAQTTPFKIVINPNGPIIFGTPEPSTPVPRRWSTNWGEKNHVLFYHSSKFNNDWIRNMNVSLWSDTCQCRKSVPFVWYNCSFNQLYWGGVLLKIWMLSCVLQRRVLLYIVKLFCVYFRYVCVQGTDVPTGSEMARWMWLSVWVCWLNDWKIHVHRKVSIWMCVTAGNCKCPLFVC